MDKKVSWHQWVVNYDRVTSKKQDYNKYKFTGTHQELVDVFITKSLKNVRAFVQLLVARQPI